MPIAIAAAAAPQLTCICKRLRIASRPMAVLSREDAKLLVREAGLRSTAPRVAVLQLLTRAGRPMSHSEVLGELGSDVWDQATIYRNLLKLADAGLARVVSRVDGVARYAASGDDDSPHLHPHFSCRSCGSVECLPKAKLTGRLKPEWHRSLEQAELQLVGDCPRCLRESPKPPRKRPNNNRLGS